METIYVGEGVYRSAKNTQYFEVYSYEQMEKMKQGKGGFSGIKVYGEHNTKFNRTDWINYKHPAVTDKQRAIIDWAVSAVMPPQELSKEERFERGLKSTTIYDLSKNAILEKPADVPPKRGGGHNDWDRMVDDEDETPLDENFIEPEEDDVKSDANGTDEPGTGTEDRDAVSADKPAKSATGKSANGKSNKKSGGQSTKVS